jgi:hypothetical protein
MRYLHFEQPFFYSPSHHILENRWPPWGVTLPGIQAPPSPYFSTVFLTERKKAEPDARPALMVIRYKRPHQDVQRCDAAAAVTVQAVSRQNPYACWSDSKIF